MCALFAGLTAVVSGGAQARPVTVPNPRGAPTQSPTTVAPTTPPKAPTPSEPTSGPAASATTSNEPSTTQLDPTIPQPCTSHDTCPDGDADGDRIKDAWEDALAFRYAPHFRLPPSKEETLRPASVDWYIQRVRMRFENKGACNRDVSVLGLRAVRQKNMARQLRRAKNLTVDGCKQNGKQHTSRASSRFYLTHASEGVRNGAPRNLWKAYVHVKRSSKVRNSNGYDIQYWVFFPYEDTPGGFNHEGDWEHITVTTDPTGKLLDVVMPRGGKNAVMKPAALTFDGTHPVIFVAKGSHMMFPKVGSFSLTLPGFFDHRTFKRGPLWRSERSLVMVGELNRPRDGQEFIRYAGRWGRVGVKESGSGERGPAFRRAWTNR